MTCTCQLFSLLNKCQTTKRISMIPQIPFPSFAAPIVHQNYLRNPLASQTTRDPLFLNSHGWKLVMAFPINAIAAMLGNCLFWSSSKAAFELCGSQTTTASGFFFGAADRLRHHLRIQEWESVISWLFFNESMEEESPFLSNTAVWSSSIGSLPRRLPQVNSELGMLCFIILLKNLFTFSLDEVSPIFEVLVPCAKESEALTLRRLTHLLLGSTSKETSR